MLGLCWDSEKENNVGGIGIMEKMETIIILGFYWDNGKNGNYYIIGIILG